MEKRKEEESKIGSCFRALFRLAFSVFVLQQSHARRAMSSRTFVSLCRRMPYGKETEPYIKMTLTHNFFSVSNWPSDTSYSYY